jgi:hypothetical protein
MRDKEIVGLWEAYLQVHQPKEEVEQLDEDFPKQVGDFLKRGGDELRKRLPGVAAALTTGKGGTVTAAQQKAKIKPVGEEVENWVNSLIDEGYDLSEYTWEDMYEMYVNLDEGNRGENETKMSNVSKLRRRQKNFAAGIVHPDEAGELEGERQSTHKSRRNVPTRGSGVREEYDTFDAILEHLVAEGYADTNESALAIMANMSEEWREEILDEANEIMSITSPEGKRKKVNRTYPSARASQNAQNARKLGALQKRQRLNPNAMGPRAARRQATDEVETNTRKSISRLNAAKNIEDKQADGDYENPIDHSKPYGKGKSGYMEVPTDYRARNRRARGR